MKMYLVINDWSNESACCVDMVNFTLFYDYENAKKHFEKKKQEIKEMNTGYEEIEERENYYCESVNGEYMYFHELVYIQEVKVADK